MKIRDTPLWGPIQAMDHLSDALVNCIMMVEDEYTDHPDLVEIKTLIREARDKPDKFRVKYEGGS